MRRINFCIFVYENLAEESYRYCEKKKKGGENCHSRKIFTDGYKKKKRKQQIGLIDTRNGRWRQLPSFSLHLPPLPSALSNPNLNIIYIYNSKRTPPLYKHIQYTNSLLRCLQRGEKFSCSPRLYIFLYSIF